MPIRLPCSLVGLPPGSLLSSYWGPRGIYRPLINVWAVGAGGFIPRTLAQIDTASDYIVLESAVAHRLGLRLPFPRQTGISGAAGTQTATLSFPPDGQVSLFVTDFREYAYLPGPLVGFHPHAPALVQQRSVLGRTGFLQFFRFVEDPEPDPPIFELHAITRFPGQTGFLPRGMDLHDFIRSLRGGP